MSLVAFSTAAQTVAPSQLTPQTLRPAEPPPQTGIELSAPATGAVPENAETYHLKIADLIADGAFPELANETEAIIVPLRNSDITVAALYEAAATIEQLYWNHGYILVRVTVPPQRLTNNGDAKLLIIDGYIEAVDTAAVSEYLRRPVAARLEPLIGRRHLTSADIERPLLLAGDLAGAALKSTLAHGTEAGGTRLIIEADHRLLTGSLTADNQLSAVNGSWEARATAAINSVYGFGEQIYGSYTTSLDLEHGTGRQLPLAIYGVGIVLPVDENGLTLNPEFTHSRTFTAEQPGVPAIVGTYDRLALHAAWPWLRTRESTLTLTGGPEYIAQETLARDFDAKLNRDSYLAVRGGPTYGTSLGDTRLQLGATLSQGITGRDTNDVDETGIPLSRQNTSPHFSKLTANASATQPLPLDAFVTAIALGQTSLGEPLFTAEQFSLDGSSALSSFPLGALTVDEGATFRTELSRPFAALATPVSAALSPYFFAAAGYGELIQPTVVENPTIAAASLGIGLRSQLTAADGTPGGILGLEIGHQFSSLPTHQDHWRGQLSFQLQF